MVFNECLLLLSKSLFCLQMNWAVGTWAVGTSRWVSCWRRPIGPCPAPGAAPDAPSLGPRALRAPWACHGNGLVPAERRLYELVGRYLQDWKWPGSVLACTRKCLVLMGALKASSSASKAQFLPLKAPQLWSPSLESSWGLLKSWGVQAKVGRQRGSVA